jgi:hypothetical protein
MQGFIVVEAFAKFALKTFSKALEVAGFDSFSARLPEWLRSVVSSYRSPIPEQDG